MTHLSHQACARIAEVMPEYKIDGITLRDVPSTFRLYLSDILSRDFLISAFGEGEKLEIRSGFFTPEYRFYDGTGMTVETEPAWEHLGHRLLQAYWSDGIEGVERVLMGLLNDSSPTTPSPK